MKFAPSLFKNDGAKNTSRPLSGSKPNQEITNDKQVIVGKISYEDVKNAITGFCNMYNQKDWAALPRLIKLAEGQFAITFPYDVEFRILCFFVNYLAYPEDLNINPEVTGWTTTSPGDYWIKSGAVSKKAMLFLPKIDTEYDFVLMTTEDNIGYKLSFASRAQKQLPALPERNYTTPKVNVNELSSIEGEDFS
ncbi:hypothetical protein GCM10022210_05030 [Mucilaginibacter dorajii]|uniref:Uncharacterized protein n=2 Tax=Mucilaginibacter dorajii TaxID=692994 RepID=A0ABP7P651_9SPHI